MNVHTAPGTGTAGDAFRVSASNVLELQGKISTDTPGAGTLTLLRWYPDIGTGEWRHWLADRPLKADTTVAGGAFSGRYDVQQGADWFLLLQQGAISVLDAYAQGVMYFVR